MKSSEIRAKITQLDTALDDDTISNAEFDRINAEIALLYADLAKAEAVERDNNIRVIKCISPWYATFLGSFGVGTRKVTNKQAYYIATVNRGRPFAYGGKIYECAGPNYRAGFGTLIVRDMPR